MNASSDSDIIALLKRMNGDKQNTDDRINAAVNLFDDTLVHYAVFNDRLELVKFLMENGAKPNIKNKRNRSARDLAEVYEKKEIAELLGN